MMQASSSTTPGWLIPARGCRRGRWRRCGRHPSTPSWSSTIRLIRRTSLRQQQQHRPPRPPMLRLRNPTALKPPPPPLPRLPLTLLVPRVVPLRRPPPTPRPLCQPLPLSRPQTPLQPPTAPRQRRPRLSHRLRRSWIEPLNWRPSTVECRRGLTRHRRGRAGGKATSSSSETGRRRKSGRSSCCWHSKRPRPRPPLPRPPRRRMQASGGQRASRPPVATL
mmetsp:Transcript_62468/g.171704  ORF Transcript_62468/g.171704 Transcript_62468/m.171704 type:complete len:221 (-) Transcript_62468:220-882(-)